MAIILEVCMRKCNPETETVVQDLFFFRSNVTIILNPENLDGSACTLASQIVAQVRVSLRLISP